VVRGKVLLTKNFAYPAQQGLRLCYTARVLKARDRTLARLQQGMELTGVFPGFHTMMFRDHILLRRLAPGCAALVAAAAAGVSAQAAEADDPRSASQEMSA
jgi:hypothetical protein